MALCRLGRTLNCREVVRGSSYSILYPIIIFFPPIEFGRERVWTYEKHSLWSVFSHWGSFPQVFGKIRARLRPNCACIFVQAVVFVVMCADISFYMLDQEAQFLWVIENSVFVSILGHSVTFPWYFEEFKSSPVLDMIFLLYLLWWNYAFLFRGNLLNLRKFWIANT